MKKYVNFIISLFLTGIVSGQDQSIIVKGKKDVTSPKFIGSENVISSIENDNSNLLDSYIIENLVCPKKAAVCLKEGTEVVQFMVNEYGDVSNFKVLNSVCPELDVEIIRVLKTTKGQWEPGLENGKEVAMDVEIELMFGIYNGIEGMLKYFSKNATKNYIAGSNYLFVKNNPEKALKYYNSGINYLPNDKALLLMRGLCLYELGDKDKAQRDWNRIVALGGMDPEEIETRITDLKGYEECLSSITTNHE